MNFISSYGLLLYFLCALTEFEHTLLRTLSCLSLASRFGENPVKSAHNAALVDDTRNKLDVRVMYRFGQNEPRVLVLPGCEEFCPLDEFIRLDN